MISSHMELEVPLGILGAMPIMQSRIPREKERRRGGGRVRERESKSGREREQEPEQAHTRLKA